MVKLFKLHKITGLGAGLILLILSITGFFLDHKQWSFLYTTTFKNIPDSAKEADKRLFEAYWIDAKDSSHRIVGGNRGIFETYDSGKHFNEMSNLQCLAIKSDKNGIYAATSDGVYQLLDSIWKPFALEGEYINAISLSQKTLVAVVEKHELIQLQRDDGRPIGRSVVEVDSSQLQESIKLGRFVRDLHYGRGLFEDDLSLLINDYSAVAIVFLAISGYAVWWLIRRKSVPKISRKLIRWHANWFAILALIPLSILAITGIFLDHSDGLAKFMKSVTIPHAVLPPVYSTLKHDIWSVDFDGKIYRIGNRYGVYKSEDLANWELESKGLAFRMIRKKDVLYVSGMGAPNRIYDGSWHMLKNSQHMFRDVIKIDNKIEYFATCKKDLVVPTFDDATLYSLMYTLHDGSFFSPWWIWINDIGAVALIVLGITGTIRWKHKRNKRKKSTF